MIQKRRALLAALIASGSTVPAGAGCLDWLFHKQAAPVQPYVVGFAPATTITPLGPPVPVGAPTISMQGPVGAVSDLTPVGPPVLGPGGYTSNFGAMRPTTAAQMPAYAMMPQPINNPSVFTGLPVTVGAPSVPVAAYRTAAETAAAAYYGGAAFPQTSYNAAAAFQTQAPAAVMAQPLYVQPQTPIQSGGGLLSRLFGNSYQTNYNNVPTTVYRPVQQIDPATGQIVIVQQPCTTTTQQVQRTPYTSLQPAQPSTAVPYYGEPTCGNEPPRYSPPAQLAPQHYAPQSQLGPPSSYAPSGNFQPGGYAPIGSGISQATAIAPAYGVPQSYASPLPSAAAPTTAPLQGYPGGYTNGLTQPGDALQMEQPRLESARPSLVPPVTSQPPWQDPWPGNGAAAYRTAEPTTGSGEPQPQIHRETNISRPATAFGGGDSHYSSLPPIPAVDEYRPPAWPAPANSGLMSPTDAGRSHFAPGDTRSQERPISPPSLNERTVSRPLQDATLARSEHSARYASTQREPERQIVKPITEAPRDDSGWFPIGP